MEGIIKTYLSIATNMAEPYGKKQVESDLMGKTMFSGKFVEARDLIGFVNSLGFKTVRPDDYFQSAVRVATEEAKKNGSNIIRVHTDDPPIHPQVKTILELILSTSGDGESRAETLSKTLSDQNFQKEVIDKVVKFVQDNI